MKLFENTREGRQSFYKSNEWQILRDYMLSLKPLCAHCLYNDMIRPATTVHHIKDIATNPELRLDTSNLECLCKSCHDKHTASESAQSDKNMSANNKIIKTEIKKLKRYGRTSTK